jgi:hypothetical protein
VYQTVIFAAVLAGVFAIILLDLFRGALSPKRMLPVSTDWIFEISANRYRPMQRLLRDDDIEFLRSQPGYNRKLAVRLRRERRKAFRGYLHCLSQEFHQICTCIQVLMLHSTYDRPDLAALLIRKRVAFQIGSARMQFLLLLHACGWNIMPDIPNMLGALDLLGRQLRQMAGVTSRLAESFS